MVIEALPHDATTGQIPILILHIFNTSAPHESSVLIIIKIGIKQKIPLIVSCKILSIGSFNFNRIGASFLKHFTVSYSLYETLKNKLSSVVSEDILQVLKH